MFKKSKVLNDKKENGTRLDLVVDNTENIVKGIATEDGYDLGKISLNYRLVKVENNQTYYSCHFENGQVIQSKMVVLTVPISFGSNFSFL